MQNEQPPPPTPPVDTSPSVIPASETMALPGTAVDAEKITHVRLKIYELSTIIGGAGTIERSISSAITSIKMEIKTKEGKRTPYGTMHKCYNGLSTTQERRRETEGKTA